MKVQRPCLHRDHARLSRELASSIPDCESRHHLFDMANLYDAIADIAERQSIAPQRQSFSEFASAA